MPHECIIQADPDASAYVEQYLVRCRCHMNSYTTWRLSDPEITCPVSGDSLTTGIEGTQDVAL